MKRIEPLLGERLIAACEQKGIPDWGRNRILGKEVNVSPAAVSKWLNDKSRPTTSKLFELAKFLEVSPEWLSSGKGPMQALDASTTTKIKEAVEIMNTLKTNELDAILAILKAINVNR